MGNLAIVLYLFAAAVLFGSLAIAFWLKASGLTAWVSEESGQVHDEYRYRQTEKARAEWNSLGVLYSGIAALVTLVACIFMAMPYFVLQWALFSI